MKKHFFISTLRNLLLVALISFIASCDDGDSSPTEVIDISIKNAPAKSDYYKGEVLDLTGLTVSLIMDNGGSVDVSFANFESNGLTTSPANQSILIDETEILITHSETGNSMTQSISYLTLNDIEGNIYPLAKIGEQIWMGENLRTTKLNDGEEIPLLEGHSLWDGIDFPAYCWYENDATNANPYGALYSWYTVETEKLCPSGWHVPSDNEWTELIDFLGGRDVAGGKMKQTGLEYWKDPNTGASNESGFSAVAGGSVDAEEFYAIRAFGYWWSSTLHEVNFAGTMVGDVVIRYDEPGAYLSSYFADYGKSVRCIKD
jgi:uncharacterized protein (TIGR02145 family)